MLKYKIVIKPVNLSDATIVNNFSVIDGYLVYNNSRVEQGVLVDEFNVQQFLEDPNNSVVVEKFKKYLREYTNELEFNEIFYKPKKVAPILNDFYNEEIRFNSKANPVLITDALKDSEVIYYQNNNYDFLNNQRMSFENKSLLFESLSANTEYKDYYIDFKIDLNKSLIGNNDYSNYIKDYKEDGIVYKNSFVNLNNKVNPFEFWTNDKIQDNIIQWKFDDNYWTGSKSEKKSISDLGFIGKIQPPFNIGDTILISQNNGAKFSEYNTKMIIEDIYYENDNWIIDVNATRLGDTPINGGIAYKFQQ